MRFDKLSETTIFFSFFIHYAPYILIPFIKKDLSSFVICLSIYQIKSNYSKDQLFFWATHYLIAVIYASGNKNPPNQIYYLIKLLLFDNFYNWIILYFKSIIHSGTDIYYIW